MLVAVPSSMNRIIDSASRGQRLIITNRTGPYGLPVRYCNDIKKIPHITGCVPQVFFYLKYRTDSDWIGVTASTPEVLSLFPDYRVPAETGDPTRFIREKRAASVGSLLLTTEALIAERPKEEKAAAGGHAGHGHGDF